MFKYSALYARLRCDYWFILSAKHHVLLPSQIVAPYDQYIPASGLLLSEWEEETGRCLAKAIGKDDVIVYLAGEDYAGCLRYLDNRIEYPLKDAGLNKRIGLLIQMIGEKR